MLNVVIDIGNSRTKMGVFASGHLQRQEILDGVDWTEILRRTTNHAPANVILSNVGPDPADEWRRQMEQQARLWVLEADTPLPFRSAYRTPQTLGRDRLAAVAGALAFYPGEDCLVVDAGTCITADLLTADGLYRGGNISPGLRMRLAAMHRMTARLPLVEPGPVEGLLGLSTETALRNGGQLGAAMELEGLQARLQADFPGLRTLITGGDGQFLAGLLKSRIFVHPDLVLYGLNKILTYNVKNVA